MRVKNMIWIYALGISINTTEATDTNLQDFIDVDDFHKINLIFFQICQKKFVWLPCS